MDCGQRLSGTSTSSCPDSHIFRRQANSSSTKAATASCDSTLWILVETSGDGFVTHVPALDFISTYGATRELALRRTRELVAGYYVAAAKAGAPVMPAPDSEMELVRLAIGT